MMAKVTKNIVDKDLRDTVFGELMGAKDGWNAESVGFHRINDRQYGILLLDVNGVERYVRLGAIVAEEREDMTARELMQKEIDEYNEKQTVKAQKAAERAEKAARDKAEREAKKKEKEAV
jgi:hypothetical protein